MKSRKKRGAGKKYTSKYEKINIEGKEEQWEGYREDEKFESNKTSKIKVKEKREMDRRPEGIMERGSEGLGHTESLRMCLRCILDTGYTRGDYQFEGQEAIEKRDKPVYFFSSSRHYFCLFLFYRHHYCCNIIGIFFRGVGL